MAAAASSVQVVNTNGNLQSSNVYPHYPSRANNQLHVSGAVRSYQHGYDYNGYPSSYNNQDYRHPSSSSSSSLSSSSASSASSSSSSSSSSSAHGYRYRRQTPPISPVVKEANSQYQYQGTNQYDEKVNPLNYSHGYVDNGGVYPYADAYRYRENSQHQLQGSTRSRVEGDPSYGNHFTNNRYQSQQQGSLHRQRYQY